MTTLKPSAAAFHAHYLIDRGKELLLIAQRAQASGCNVIIDDKNGRFYPSNENFHGRLSNICDDISDDGNQHF